MMHFVLAHLSSVLKCTLHKYNSFSSLIGQLPCATKDNKLLTADKKLILAGSLKLVKTIKHPRKIPKHNTFICNWFDKNQRFVFKYLRNKHGDNQFFLSNLKYKTSKYSPHTFPCNIFAENNVRKLISPK
jgi:hypothetical protein